MPLIASDCLIRYGYRLDEWEDNSYGIILTTFATLIVLSCIAVLWKIPNDVAQQFTDENLLKLWGEVTFSLPTLSAGGYGVGAIGASDAAASSYVGPRATLPPPRREFVPTQLQEFMDQPPRGQ